MATKSHNIRIDEDIKERAAALYASLGLNLSDAVNVFLRISLDENGFPFPVKLRRGVFKKEPVSEKPDATPEAETAETRAAKEYPAHTPEERRAALHALLEFAERHPVLPKDYKFNREECYDRAVFRR